VAEVRQKLGPPIEGSFQDEMRVGQKNKLTYRCARRGSRPRAIHDQRTQSTYLFGAVCPERGTGSALDAETMQLNLDEIATVPKISRSRAISRSCRCRRAHLSSTAKRTSGSSCANVKPSTSPRALARRPGPDLHSWH
jgi:hypothetical protein